MNKWGTFFMAVSNKDGQIHKFSGNIIEASTWESAQQWCDENAGHLFVDGLLHSRIPCKEGTTDEPDFSKQINYSDKQCLTN